MRKSTDSMECDTVKKARMWLDAAGRAYAFHDYKKAGVPEDRLRQWVAAFGWEKVLNRAGTTFRKLDEADKAGVDAEKAVALMLAHPSLIRRPVLDYGTGLLIGFKPEEWSAALG